MLTIRVHYSDLPLIKQYTYYYVQYSNEFYRGGGGRNQLLILEINS